MSAIRPSSLCRSEFSSIARVLAFCFSLTKKEFRSQWPTRSRCRFWRSALSLSAQAAIAVRRCSCPLSGRTSGQPIRCTRSANQSAPDYAQVSFWSRIAHQSASADAMQSFLPQRARSLCIPASAGSITCLRCLLALIQSRIYTWRQFGRPGGRAGFCNMMELMAATAAEIWA